METCERMLKTCMARARLPAAMPAPLRFLKIRSGPWHMTLVRVTKMHMGMDSARIAFRSETFHVPAGMENSCRRSRFPKATSIHQTPAWTRTMARGLRHAARAARPRATSSGRKIACSRKEKRFASNAVNMARFHCAKDLPSIAREKQARMARVCGSFSQARTAAKKASVVM